MSMTTSTLGYELIRTRDALAAVKSFVRATKNRFAQQRLNDGCNMYDKSEKVPGGIHGAHVRNAHQTIRAVVSELPVVLRQRSDELPSGYESEV
eukprot:6212833-Pleurochrysis_carterae.AAC.3